MRNTLFFMLIVLLSTSMWGMAQAQEDPNCSGAPAPQLNVGGYGQVTPGDANTLRAHPSTASDRVGSIPGGETFTVLEGPVCADGYNWWQVDYAGQVGWTAEGNGDTYFLVAFNPTPTATPGPVQDFDPPHPFVNQLANGVRARVINDGYQTQPLRLRLHEEPGLSTATTGVVQEDTLVTVEDGPQQVDGLRWWFIRTEDGQHGWVIEGQPGNDPDTLPYERTLLALCITTANDRVAFIGTTPRGQVLSNGYIYTANLDGSSPCIYDRLKLAQYHTTWGVFNYLPWELVPSPDGQQIAYIDWVNDVYSLYIMNQDGTRQRLTDTDDIYWVAWTPDGSRLLYTLGDIFTSNVWTQRPDGSAAGFLTSGAGSKSWATWLADNETVIYIEQYGAQIQRHAPTETILWRVNVQSGGLRELIRFTDDVRDVLVSPDGRYLFITGFTQQLEPFVDITGEHTLVLDASTGEVVYEDDQYYSNAIWSRESRTIIHTIYPPTSVLAEGTTPVALGFVPVMGGETFTIETGLYERYDMLRWLDDDNMLVYANTSGTLTVLNIRTGELTAAADFTIP